MFVAHARVAVAATAVSVYLAVVPASSGSPPPASSGHLSLDSVVGACNARDAGAPGWRRVRIDLLDGETITRTFTVVNVWQRGPRSVRTLYYLEQPTALAGTAYLQIEDLDTDLSVFLYLPTSNGHVLSVASEDLGEGLLGSDFAYTDLQTLLPVRRYRYRAVNRMRLLDRPAVAVEASPDTGLEVGWSRATFFIDEESAVLIGADYYFPALVSSPSREPGKRMRVERMERVDGVWTATRMAMTTARRQTRITLLEARFHLGAIDASLFELESLPHLQRSLEALAKRATSDPHGS